MDQAALYKAWELHTEDGTMTLDIILGRGTEVTQATILAIMEIQATILAQVEILVTILVLGEILAIILALGEILVSILVEQLQPGDIILAQVEILAIILELEEILDIILVQVEILAITQVQEEIRVTILVLEEIQDLIQEEQRQHGDTMQVEDHQPILLGVAGFILQLQGQQYQRQGDHQIVKHLDPITVVVMVVDQASGDRDLCSRISS